LARASDKAGANPWAQPSTWRWPRGTRAATSSSLVASSRSSVYKKTIHTNLGGRAYYSEGRNSSLNHVVRILEFETAIGLSVLWTVRRESTAKPQSSMVCACGSACLRDGGRDGGMPSHFPRFPPRLRGSSPMPRAVQQHAGRHRGGAARCGRCSSPLMHVCSHTASAANSTDCRQGRHRQMGRGKWRGPGGGKKGTLARWPAA